jgi:hypothetical protein
VAHASGLQAVDQLDLDGSGHHLLFVLKAVAGADIHKLDARGKTGK